MDFWYVYPKVQLMHLTLPRLPPHPLTPSEIEDVKAFDAYQQSVGKLRLKDMVVVQPLSKPMGSLPILSMRSFKILAIRYPVANVEAYFNIVMRTLRTHGQCVTLQRDAAGLCIRDGELRLLWTEAVAEDGSFARKTPTALGGMETKFHSRIFEDKPAVTTVALVADSAFAQEFHNELPPL
ncbi:hypothetical protein [Xanthomonas phage RTH11]|nr:hypothetical protein [Xanthomonas phage RTH11]